MRASMFSEYILVLSPSTNFSNNSSGKGNVNFLSLNVLSKASKHDIVVFPSSVAVIAINHFFTGEMKTFFIKFIWSYSLDLISTNSQLIWGLSAMVHF